MPEFRMNPSFYDFVVKDTIMVYKNIIHDQNIDWIFFWWVFGAVISDESGRLAMTNIMCNVFRTVLATTPQDLLAVVNLSANRIAPAHEGVELGIGDASIIKVLTEAYGRKDDQVKAQLKVGVRYF